MLLNRSLTIHTIFHKYSETGSNGCICNKYLDFKRNIYK
jgi:hypothetical protein